VSSTEYSPPSLNVTRADPRLCFVAGVVVQELLESKSKTLTGAWEQETSGGSHLNPDWRKNPKFSLKVGPIAAEELHGFLGLTDCITPLAAEQR
jgi:hypothetical protein